MGSVRYTEDREQTLRRLADRSTAEFRRQLDKRESRLEPAIGLVTVGPELNWALQFTFANGHSRPREWCGVPVVVDPALGDEYVAWTRAV